MGSSTSLHLALDDLLGELRHARRNGDLGRMALIAWCEVRPWARRAGEAELAERASEIVMHSPHASRGAFLRDIDALIDLLALVLQRRGQGLAHGVGPPGAGPAPAPGAAAPTVARRPR